MIVACAVQRIQEVDVLVAMPEGSTREEIDEALIIAADSMWGRSQTIETYPNGPRSIMDEEPDGV